jgi:hypothetical protein
MKTLLVPVAVLLLPLVAILSTSIAALRSLRTPGE